MRTGGVHRIGRHELMRKLTTLKLATVSTQNGLMEAAVPGNLGIEQAEVFAGLCDIAWRSGALILGCCVRNDLGGFLSPVA